MIAPARRNAAAPVVPGRHDAVALWQAATEIRQEWLGHGLATAPADRATTEDRISRIYARISRTRPRFEWVESPAKALPLVAGWPTLDTLYRWIRDPLPPGTPPLASDLAMVTGRLRGALSAGVSWPDPELSPARRPKNKEPWPDGPPREALAAGVPPAVVLHRAVRDALHRSLGTGFRQPVKGALGPDLPVCWYGQQEAPWVGYYDMLDRLGLASWDTATSDHFGEWLDLTRAGGWWWPGERVCVVVERPATVRVEAVPGAWHEEVRLLAVGYRDGWQL